MPRASDNAWFGRRHGHSHALPRRSPPAAVQTSPSVVQTTTGDETIVRGVRTQLPATSFTTSAHANMHSDQTIRPDDVGQPPQYHWHQDTHYHYTLAAATPPAHEGRPALTTIPAPPALSRSGGCLVVFLVLLGALLTFLVMLMGLALAGQIFMLR